MRTVLAVCGTFIAVLVAAAPVSAQTIATPNVPSKMATYGGVTAYSVQDTDSGNYRLMFDTNSNGSAEEVPVRRRSVPFDVDLGPGIDGRVLAVYSRCSQEPEMDRTSAGPHPAWTTARGCDLYQFDFREQRESLIEGPSTSATTEVLPSIWRDEIAFVRVYHRRSGLRGRAPYLYVRRVDATRAPSRRQPGGARGSSGVPGPMELDLAGPRLAFSWVYEREGGGVSEARLDTVDSTHRKIAGQGWKNSVARYLTPHISLGRVVYGFQRSQSEGDGTRSHVSEAYRYRITTGDLDRAEAPAQMFAALHDRRSDLTVFGTTSSFLTKTGCIGEPCLIARTETPRWQFVRRIPPPSGDCGDVAFAEDTDHGAFNIEASGVSCEVAREVAAASHNAGLRYRAEGFLCEGTRVTNGLTRDRFTCRRDDDRITFVRS